MRTCTVYLRKNRIYVHSEFQALSGLRIASGPFLETDRSNFEAIGKYIGEALQASISGVPDPSDKNVLRPLYELVGVKNWSQFSRNARCVSVELVPDTLLIVPSEKSAGGGYQHLEEAATRLPINASNAEIGLAAFEALSRCR